MKQNADEMKVLVITDAGMSTRFSESVGYECLKCLYSENGFEESILSRQLQLDPEYFDRVIIVGGYKYEDLKVALSGVMPDRIVTVFNEHFSDYGSGYSLLMGLEKAFETDCREIVFAEGDLLLDKAGFMKVSRCEKDVVTATGEVIRSDRSVVFYLDAKGHIHYVFSTTHGLLRIDEPFSQIRNSGQVWKFTDINRLKDVCASLTQQQKAGTNLEIIQGYFGERELSEYEIITFDRWVNCNTIEDYKGAVC